MNSQAIPKQKVVKLYREALAQGIPIQKLDHKLDKFMARQESTKKVETDIDTDRKKVWQRQLPLLVRVFAIAFPTLF